MNRISSLSIDELNYLCALIPPNETKSFFKINPKLFQKIRPGFRVKSLSPQDAAFLLSKNKDTPAIADFIDFQITQWLDSILECYHANLSRGKSTIDALIDTLPDSVFDKKPELYFRLTSEEHTEEEKVIVCQVVSRLQQSASRTVTSATDTAEYQQTLSRLQEQLETQKTNYEAILSDERQQFSEYKAKTSSSLSALSQYEKEIQSLRQELARLKQLQSRSDAVEIPSCITHEHISLCRICIPDYSTGQVWLRRIADLRGKTLYEFYQNKDLPPYFENRELLYKKNGPETPGYIGIWEWDSVPSNTDPQKDYVSSYYASYPIIEALLLPGCYSSSDIINYLINGFVQSIQGRVLIGYFDDAGLYQGLLCTANDFDVRGNKFFLKDTAFTLSHYELRKEDFIEVDDRYICRYLNLGTPNSLIAVKDPLAVVKSIILKRSLWTTFKQYGYLRNDWQKCRDFLTKLPTENLFSEISQICHCSIEQAHQYVDNLIMQASTYLDHTDIETEILQLLIENNNKLMTSCMHSIEANWQTSHNKQLKEAQDVLNEISARAEQEQNRYDILLNKYQNTEALLAHITQQIDEKRSLAEDVEKLVSERIATAQKNAAEFIASFAFISQPAPVSVPPFPVTAASNAIISTGSPVFGKIDECASYQELLNILDDALVDSGVSEKYSDSMAAFLYSAYVNHIPILLVGPNAVCIANALSASLYGRTAGRLICSDEFSSHDLSVLQECTERLLIVQGRFSYSWIPYLKEWMSEMNTYFIITQPFVEDLIIEPHSLYNYVLPIFTELFVEKSPEPFLYGGVISDDLILPRFSIQSTLHQKALTKLGAGRLVQSSIQTILSLMHALPYAHNEYDVLFALLPYAYATGKTETLSEMMDSGQIQSSKDVKDIISTFLGMTNE